MKRISIITIGGGWVVNNRHLLSLKRSGLYDIVGAISNDEERAVATARRYELPHYATSCDFTQGWQAEADAVMIGTIPHVHFEIAQAALEAGKHVLTEKPMTVDQADGPKLKALAEEKGKVLAVVHNFQFSRASNSARRDIARGRLGNVKAVYGVQLCNHARNIPAWCDELPLGLFFDESPHFYYMMRWLGGGDLELLDASVWKHDSGRNTPRMVTGEYRGPKGFPLYLHINFESSLTEWHVTIVGDKGTAIVDLWRDIYVYLPNDGVHTAVDITRTSVYSVAQHLWGVFTGGVRYALKKHLYGNEEIVTRFRRAIEGEDCLAGMNADEGCRVVAMQHELINKARYH